MAEIAYGGIAALFGGTSFSGSYYLTPDGIPTNSSGTPIGTSVFEEDLASLHRTADLVVIPPDWTAWAPDPLNNEWDAYSIGTAPSIGSATMVDGGEIDLPSADLNNDYDHDTIHYKFDPTSQAWQDLAYGESLTVTFTVSATERGGLFNNVIDSDTFTVTLTFTKLCFVRGTMIETADGQVRIEDVRPGMMVRTLDHGSQPVRWIGRTVLGGKDRQIPDNLRPIRIKAGALGENTPSHDLSVSPQHRILVKSRIAQRMFGTDEVLVPAKQLLQVDGVDIDRNASHVEYYHMMFDQHQLVRSNGALTESLYLGAEALKGLGMAAVDEILEILPELRKVMDGAEAPEGARMLLSGRAARQLTVRHIQNKKMLVN